MLAAIVEIAAGEAYEDFLLRELFRPAGSRRRDTGFRTGASYGCSYALKRFLDEDVVVVLFCSAAYGASPLAQAVEDRVVAAAFGEQVPVPPRVEPRQSFDSVAGVYALPSDPRTPASTTELCESSRRSSKGPTRRCAKRCPATSNGSSAIAG